MNVKRKGQRMLSLLLTLCMIIGLIPVSSTSVAAETEGSYSRINVQATKAGVFELAEAQFAAKGKTVELVYNETSSTGDIVVITNGAEDTYGEEGYSISVENGVVTVTSATNAGAVYGLQDVLQQLEKGAVTDVNATQPFKGTRALFVDCGRKYFSVAWFEEIIREMAWNGMNTLYMSFSNDEGFRFLLDDMSLSFDDGSGNTVTYDDDFMSHLVDNPERVSDSAFLTERNANATDEGNSRVVSNYDNNKYLTQRDMEKILAYAKAYGVDIIPEFNSPGHIGQVLWYFPEYRIQGTWYEDGQPHYGLDLTNTEAANFGAALVKKYVDFFATQGCTAFCVGGDEYSEGNATYDQIAAYTNGLVEYVESKGMTAYAWNDGQAAAQGLLKSSAIVNCWNGYNAGYAYNSINFNSRYLYYVLKKYDWKPSAQTLFETWTPLTYSGDIMISSDKTEGSCLAIWCDIPNNETSDYILESMLPNIQAFGYRMWNFSETATASLSDDYADYSEFASSVTNAPVVDESAVLATVGYALTEEDIDTTLPEPVSGSYYELVSFSAPTVSTNSGWYSGANNLIDGDTSTVAWTNANQAVGHYMQVDLGTEQNIATITVTSPSETNDICNKADVKVSADGQIWRKIGSHPGNSGNSVTDSYTINSNIRYIRVEITEAKSNWWQLAEISWSPKAEVNNTIADGTYIIVNDGNKAMTHTTSGTGFAMNAVTIEGTTATPINEVYEWTFAKQTDGTYHITDCDGEYLYINSDGIAVSKTAQKITATISGNKVQLSNESNAINYYASNGQVFSRWNTGTGDSNNMQTLYKKVTGGNLITVDLYNAIISAQKFNNDDGRYGKDEFATLQTVLNESISLYQNASEENTTITQDAIDAQTAALEAAIAAVEISDTSIDYIEIPIEILDFRADGVMFEYAQNTAGKGLYELLSDTKFGNLTYANETVTMPGTLGDRLTEDEWNGWVDDCKRTGLVEDYLVNGAPVYKEATVDYVAKLIAKGYFTELSSSVTNWNSTISTKVESLYARYNTNTDTNTNLGTWSDTLAKTSTQANGGDMTWSSVTTCYDLAYYVLNNMWRSTEAADGVDAYNKVVGDRTILRMLSGEDGYYYLDSTKEISYNGNYVYNTDLETENTAETKFTPINDLGYEAGDSYGDTTDKTSGINFHFTLHANGSFVYNADDNLYFYFDGDDDVYYYINGQLVMDIGGAHSHCDDEIYLNDIADELGLVDGGIYTFDMFYAERHTTQANLEFRTNIKIMDTMSTTSKGQYKASTGEAIAYGAIVDENTTVAYSFNLLNLRSVNVTDITFIDESLGSNISGDSITLYDSNKTNGATTAITDIIVYYHTYDRPAPSEPGTLNESTPVVKTVAEITELINTANANKTSLVTGSYRVAISSEEDLKSLLELGVPIDTQICVYGVKRTVTADDRPYINTVTSRAYYISNNKKIALNGIASQKLTVLNSFSSAADKEQIVLDYGKAIQISIADITTNIHTNSGVTAEFYGITSNGSHNQIRTNVSNICTTLDTAYKAAVSNGAAYLRGTKGIATHIEFKLEKMLSEIEKGYAVYKITDTALADTEYATYYLFVEVDIIPATNVYYETDFADGIFELTTTGEAWSPAVVKGDASPENVQDSYYFGTEIYGYDSSYQNDKYQSNGSSWYVVGQGVKTVNNTTNYTEAKFSFTGTGFDLISRTGTEEGAIRVDIYSDASRTNLVKSVTVLNKSETDLTLYQIPVVSVEMSAHGTYYVTISVNAAYTNETYPSLNRGGNFHFDAIKVFNPIDVSAGVNATGDALTAYQAYCSDGEAKAEISEVRNILISAADYDVTTTVEGVAFVDKIYNDEEGKTGVTIADYTVIGPNNEVYLSYGQGIAFKIKADTIPASVDIGAKSANGDSVTMETKIASGTDENAVNITRSVGITSSTAQFFDLANAEDVSTVFNSDGEAYVIVKNTGEGILSITDIKIAYGHDVSLTAAYFLVDSDVMAVAQTFMLVSDEAPEEIVEPNYDILSMEFNSDSCRLLRKATITVTTTQDVEQLKVKNGYGWTVYSSASYVDGEDGVRVWTVKIMPFILGTQQYTVVGYGADGTTGASATASIRVKLF